MHPKISFPGELSPIFHNLSQPLHDRSRRDRLRHADIEKEVSLANGYAVSVSGFEGEEHLDVVLDDFCNFMRVVMEVPAAADGYSIRLMRGDVSKNPEGGSETHEIRVSSKGCDVVAADLAGLRRAVFRLEDEMLIRRAPILPLGEQTRWTRIKTRISRSPVAPYRWLSGWELEDDNDYYPDTYLSRLAHYGVNGLWVPGLLRNLVASKVIPELGPERHRLEKLKHLIARAARHGIRIYFFCIEPRALPEGHPAALAHPEILGAKQALCTSEPLVLNYIREVMETHFREVPRLAGVINIFCGERYTHCWATGEHVQDCPRCRQRSKAEVLSETFSAFMEGMRASSPSAEFIAWAYMMASSTESQPMAPMLEVMKASHPDMVWMGNFEHGTKKTICGKDVEVHEYSLSCIGPSQNFRDLADAVKQEGRQIYAKLQMGNSYEMSSVPYIPVPGIVYDKIACAADVGVTGAMLGWVIGGSPGPMLRAAGESAFEPRPPKDALLLRLAAIEWGERSASAVTMAWEKFSKGWQCYPFHNAVLYWGPITRGPAYQLHLEREMRLAKPYNWGINRSRERQPFEDQYARWLGYYSVEEITGSFRGMAQTWQEGLRHLETALRDSDGDGNLERQLAVAAAVRLQCLAAANVYEFYALRDQLRNDESGEHASIIERMQEVGRNDLQVAEDMKRVMAIEPLIGFESEIYDYSYSLALIEEKILQVNAMLATLSVWRRYGVDPAILNRTVEETEGQRPDDNPDLWGD